jgi:hypothetical protein
MKLSGYRYHHIGIPTQEPVPGEVHIPHLKMHAFGFEESRFGVEWIRFDEDNELPELVKTVPHVAFVVEDLAAALEGEKVLIAANSPMPGITVAFIEHNGAPVEFLQFTGPEAEYWPGGKDPAASF